MSSADTQMDLQLLSFSKKNVLRKEIKKQLQSIVASIYTDGGAKYRNCSRFDLISLVLINFWSYSSGSYAFEFIFCAFV